MNVRKISDGKYNYQENECQGEGSVRKMSCQVDVMSGKCVQEIELDHLVVFHFKPLNENFTFHLHPKNYKKNILDFSHTRPNNASIHSF